jgi:general secretion pathway protein B
VPLLADLPQELRSQIAKITITGSVYSDSPAQRLLLVNNLVLPQGSQVGPELTLEEIQPRSSVFSFKGTRFRVMH